MIRFLLILVFTSSVFAQTSQVNVEPVYQFFPDKKLMQEINDAWSTLDPSNAARYYDTSGSNIYFDVSPFSYKGWREYSKGAAESFKAVSSMKYTVGEDAEINVEGNFAYGTSSLRLQIDDVNGEKHDLNLRWTVIWQHKNDSWLIVHEHLSVPAE